MEKVKLTSRIEPSDMDVYVDPKKDLTSERIIVLSDNRDVTIRRHDPYGFWTMHMRHGRIPDQYQGQYTLFEYAITDLKKFLDEKKLTITEIKDTYQTSHL